MFKQISVAFLVVISQVAAVRGGDWQTDPEVAGRLASTERKDLFLLFTGTSWCGACVKFNSQILGEPEFIQGTTSFIRVKMEFPGSEDQLPSDRRETYIRWRDRHGVRAYPTVILSDPDGLPYALIGFDEESSPADFVRKLDRSRLVRDKRDTAFSRAERSRGQERAQALDEALTAIQSATDRSLVVYQGELVIRFYRKQIEEVIALDIDNKAGLRDRYRRLIAGDDEHNRLNQLNS